MEERVYIHSETCCICIVLDPHLIGGILTCKVSCNGGGGGGGGAQYSMMISRGGTYPWCPFPPPMMMVGCRDLLSLLQWSCQYSLMCS